MQKSEETVGLAFNRQLRTAMERRPYRILQLPQNRVTQIEISELETHSLTSYKRHLLSYCGENGAWNSGLADRT